MKKKTSASRRNFLEYLLYGGGGVFAGSHLAKAKGDSAEPSKFITADGKVVMIDPRHIRKLGDGRLSNKDLEAWIKEGNRHK